jgi:glycosyltransferase involved in cell wall biosynthesis
MRVAFIHEWLVTYAGSEAVLAELIKLYPQADLFAVVDFLSDADRQRLGGKRAQTTFIQGLPGAKKRYRSYLPLMPLAIEQFDLSGYDLVISSSHAVAKGVLTGPDQVHISYVHSPIRYAWDMQHQYLREAGLDKGLKSWLARWLLHKIRIWDSRTAHGVNQFIANSHFIARRIRKVYGRDSLVINPPVDTERFSLVEKKEDFYLAASRMVPYKRMDLIAKAFASMPGRRLIVVGDGPDAAKVRAAGGSNVEFLGYQSDAALRDLMGRARAFVFAAEEDFGIIPVEAQACGTPVIAFGKGGALETVVDHGENPTGVFFANQTVESICGAVDEFERRVTEFSPTACRANAETFSAARFQQEIHDVVTRCMDEAEIARLKAKK